MQDTNEDRVSGETGPGDCRRYGLIEGIQIARVISEDIQQLAGRQNDDQGDSKELGNAVGEKFLSGSRAANSC